MASLEADIRRVLELLVPKIRERSRSCPGPVILGITGLQGSGKSTWASKVVELLSSAYNLRAITISLDDLYKTHDDLTAQRDKDPDNKLYRTRGQPGTHEEQLAARFFSTLKSWDGKGGELKVPSFDKSQFNGAGDRAPEDKWPKIAGRIDVVVFEGWCVGFRSLPEDEVQTKHQAAQQSAEPDEQDSINTLADHSLDHLHEVNKSLKRYNESFMGSQHFDFLVHLDTDDLRNVYRWRLQQEHAMIKMKGMGMDDDAVVSFVRGYMPGYELYLDGLREGFFGEDSSRQVRVVLDRERHVEKIEVL